MEIKSLEELKQVREQHRNKTSLRHRGENIDENIPEYTVIRIGMATCGIAAGARETMNAIMEEISRNNIENVRVIPVGCAGSCAHEPIIQVHVPNSEPVVYGNVRKENVKEIVESHIINKTPVEHMIIHVEFNRM